MKHAYLYPWKRAELCWVEMAKAAVNAPQSKRFAGKWAIWHSRQRLEYGSFSAAFGVRFVEN